MGIDRHGRHRREQERLAVGRCGLHRLDTEAALRAGAVLDDDRLIEGHAQALGEVPRQRVARAAGGERER